MASRASIVPSRLPRSRSVQLRPPHRRRNLLPARKAPDACNPPPEPNHCGEWLWILQSQFPRKFFFCTTGSLRNRRQQGVIRSATSRNTQRYPHGAAQPLGCTAQLVHRILHHATGHAKTDHSRLSASTLNHVVAVLLKGDHRAEVQALGRKHSGLWAWCCGE